tara:strand:+ start:309 stop:557 length:249 start_codon:yes stop_codon:yes gene_type:complete
LIWANVVLGADVVVVVVVVGVVVVVAVVGVVVEAVVSTVFSTFPVEDVLLLDISVETVEVLLLTGLDVLEGFKILLRASSNI